MRALGLALLLVSGSAGMLSAATIHVPADRPTLQAGIDHAVTGDTVLVAPGTYSGAGNRDILIDGKDIALIGTGGSAQTLIDLYLPSGWRFGFQLRGQTRQMLIRGFTISHGYGEYVVSSGGINIETGSPTLEDLRIIDCRVSEHYGPPGAGIRCVNASPLLRNVLLQNCEGSSAILLAGGAPELEDVTIRDCNSCGMGCNSSAARLTRVHFIEDSLYGLFGGALNIWGEPSPWLVDCTFEDNYAFPELMDGFGGAIYCAEASPMIEGTIFRGNLSGKGGAISFADCPAPTLVDCLFVDNHADKGAALYLWNSTVTAQGITFSENGADWFPGGNAPRSFAGTVYAEGASQLALSNSIIAFTAQGPGIHMQAPASAVVTCSDLFDNEGGHTSGTLGDIIGVDGNISADPLFCGESVPEEVYTLAASSPCVPAGNDCGVLMGALPVGCIAISGHAEDTEGQPIAGVVILGSPSAVSSSAAGDYLTLAPLGWTGTLSPFLGGYAFTPPQRSYTNLQTDVGGQDYVGRRVTLIHVPAESPSIQAAIAIAADGDSILVAPGTYSGGGFIGVSLLGKDLLIMGGGSDSTTLDCAGAGRAFDINQGESAFALIQGFRIVNGFVQGYVGQGGGLRVSGASPTLRDLVVSDCTASDRGGGMYLDNSQSLLEDVVVERCGDHLDFDAYGGGIACHLGAPTLRRVLLAGNEAGRDGGGLYCQDSDPQLEQVTLVGNVSDAGGGGLGCDQSASPTLTGCLTADNAAATGGGIYCRDAGSAPAIACSDVFANAGGNYGGTLADQTGINGNISADPLFCDAPGGEYTLDALSPCLPWNNDCHVQMGAYGWGCGVTAAEETTPAAFAFAPPHPNPFNPKTTLRFALPRAAAVDLAIFDVSGRRVARLVAGDTLPAGQHAIDWEGRDEAGRALPSGVYLARLSAAGLHAERKLSLLR